MARAIKLDRKIGQGTVENWNAGKGLGYITSASAAIRNEQTPSGGKIFLHIGHLISGELELSAGQTVYIESVGTEKGRVAIRASTSPLV